MGSEWPDKGEKTGLVAWPGVGEIFFAWSSSPKNGVGSGVVWVTGLFSLWWEGTNLSLSLLKQGHLNYPLIAQMAVSSLCFWALESVVSNRQMVDASSEPWQCSSLGWFQIYEIICFQAEACRWGCARGMWKSLSIVLSPLSVTMLQLGRWSRKRTAKSMYCHIIKAPWIQASWCETSFDCGYLKFDYFIHFLYCGQVWATMMFAVARPIEQFDRNPNLMKFVITVV